MTVTSSALRATVSIAQVLALALSAAACQPHPTPSPTPVEVTPAHYSAGKEGTHVLIKKGQNSGLGLDNLDATLQRVDGRTASLLLGGAPAPWAGELQLDARHELRRGDYVITVVDANDDMPGRPCQAVVAIRRA